MTHPSEKPDSSPLVTEVALAMDGTPRRGLSTDPDLDADGLFKDDGAAMSLASGRRVNPLRMTADDVHVEDIAHALARLCRFNGHVGGFLSVARHSLWVADHLRLHGHPDLALVGLLHDASEAYLGDMIRPMKRSPLGASFREAEAIVEATIAEHFGLPHPLPDPVIVADTYVLLNRELDDARWNWTSTPDRDEAEFLGEYARLTMDTASA